MNVPTILHDLWEGAKQKDMLDNVGRFVDQTLQLWGSIPSERRHPQKNMCICSQMLFEPQVSRNTIGKTMSVYSSLAKSESDFRQTHKSSVENLLHNQTNPFLFWIN